MGRRKLLGLALCVGAIAAGCSVLAPSDDELLGGDGKDGGSATGGTAGTSDSGVGGVGGATGGSGGSIGGSGGSTGGSGGVAASGGSGGVAASGGTGGASGGAAGSGGTGATAGFGGSGGTTCTPGSVSPKALPTAMYLMLDRTNSMAGDWSKVRNAVQDFVQNQQMIGKSVALQYMPPEPGSGSCSGNGYDSPAVPMATMPGGANAITQSLNSTAATGTSQLLGAITGGTTYCTTLAKQQPDTQVVFAMLTDYSNLQDSCGIGTQGMMAALSGALNADPPVYSWFLNLGGTGFLLDQLADAGGTDQAVDVGSLGSIRDALLRAAVGCRYAIPPGGNITSVSVGGKLIPKVAKASNCNNNAGYYELGAPMNAVELCYSSCNQVASSLPVQLNVTCP